MAEIPGHAESTAAAELRRVIWSERAVAEVGEIYDYVVDNSPMAARRLVERLVIIAQSLDIISERGRPISRRRRELTVVPPYLIRYRVEAEQVLILEVRHGSRRPDET